MVAEFTERGVISKLNHIYGEIDISAGLQDHVLQLGNVVLENELVAGKYLEPSPSIRDSASVQSSADTILEIVNVHSGIRSYSFLDSKEEERSAEFAMTAKSRLIRVSDNTVLDEWELKYHVQPVAVREWGRDEAKSFRAALEAGYKHLADQLLANLLGLSDLSALVPENTSIAGDIPHAVTQITE